MDNPLPRRNQCGECQACCVVLPIAEPDFVKPAGVPCQHLCETGCQLFGTPELPNLCRDFYCEWRLQQWLNDRPQYRPDVLGVLFMVHRGVLTVFEVHPGALMSQRVAYAKSRLRSQLGNGLVKNYPLGVLDVLQTDPAKVTRGTADINPLLQEWHADGGNEFTLRLKNADEAESLKSSDQEPARNNGRMQ